MFKRKIEVIIHVDDYGEKQIIRSIETGTYLRDGDLIEGVLRVVKKPASPAPAPTHDMEALKPGAPMLMDNAKKPERIPFDLEAAKAGAPLVTRDGRKARFLAHVPEAKEYPIAAYIEGSESLHTFKTNGAFGKGITDGENRRDLFMAPKPKRTVWVNIYGNRHAAIFDSEKEAREVYNYARSAALAVAVPVEIEA